MLAPTRASSRIRSRVVVEIRIAGSDERNEALATLAFEFFECFDLNSTPRADV